jgi:hypothetical protein
MELPQEPFLTMCTLSVREIARSKDTIQQMGGSFKMGKSTARPDQDYWLWTICCLSAEVSPANLAAKRVQLACALFLSNKHLSLRIKKNGFSAIFFDP